MSRFVNRYLKFKKAEDGTATVEFVLLFPVFIFLFLMGFEAGYYMVRTVMLERAVDLSVREVRLGDGGVPDYTLLKANICAQAAIIPDCMESVQVDLRRIDAVPGGTTAMRNDAICNDKTEDAAFNEGNTYYDVGSANNVMMLRVCALSEPLFPTTGIGVGMRSDRVGSEVAIVATTLFVNEPGVRTIAQKPKWMNQPHGSGNGGANRSSDNSELNNTSY
jgi:hypothetical protein